MVLKAAAPAQHFRHFNQSRIINECRNLRRSWRRRQRQTWTESSTARTTSTCCPSRQSECSKTALEDLLVAAGEWEWLVHAAAVGGLLREVVQIRRSIRRAASKVEVARRRQTRHIPTPWPAAANPWLEPGPSTVPLPLWLSVAA